MKLKSLSPLVAIGMSAAMLLAHVPASHAKLDESRKVNWENAKKLYPMLMDAVATQRLRDAYNLTGELRLNLDYVQEKLEATGQRLHEKDRNWAWAPKKNAVVENLKRTRVAIGILGSKLKDVGSSPDSEMNTVKSEWQTFVTSYDDLWAEYVNHGKELDAMVKAFYEDCPGCR
ncbi:hypothetical protein [Alkalinema sp. FACHB-956]|uniref:hypothetical protein n=1 Tax=Alkalinema sp. FACHB-956 TaxID=2692768 RepID=UPI00168455A8|nr:hypothetical protein [Alkalinema sp. FACHB-956]MBD2326164.1 hypothetical protein [Alkalinema sp. FACHB-956]